MQERRKIKVIKRDFQYNFMLKGVLAVVISLNLIIFSVYTLDRLYGLPGTVFNVFSISLLLMEIAAVAIVMWIGRDVSFHIAGPVYAIERTLKGMDEGNVFQRLKLREGDNFLETADTLNRMLENYQNRIRSLQELTAGGQLSDAELRQIKDELAWFQTSKEDRPAAEVNATGADVAQPAQWADRQSA